jgi:hypothetical protein
LTKPEHRSLTSTEYSSLTILVKSETISKERRSKLRLDIKFVYYCLLTRLTALYADQNII